MNEPTCKTHPAAPHGFLRNASHTENRYVCECEYWEEPKMNKRIRQLARQADPEYTGVYDDNMGHALVGDEAIKQFAELIVRECCEVAHCNFHVDGLTLGEIMKKHFGVD
jgi:hypothetical protein